MPLNAAQLEARLARGEIAPVYLIAGSEDLLRLEAADAVRAAAKAQGYAEREVYEVAGDFDWRTVEAAFATLSLFSTRRLIDVRLPSGKPARRSAKKDDDSDAHSGAKKKVRGEQPVLDGAPLIERYCANPPPDLCLLITAAEWGKAFEGAWSRAVDKAGVFLPIWPLKPAELPAWITRRLKSRGVQADAGAVAILAERVEGNLLAAAQEVDKLALLVRGERLGSARMRDLVADSARYDVFGVTDAAMAGDAARALRILRGLRAEGEPVVPVMNWVAGQVQVLARCSAVMESGGNVAATMQQAGVWESRQAAYRRCLSRLGTRGSERLLSACAELDLATKGRSDFDPWQLMERVLLAMAQAPALCLLDVE